MYMYAYERRGTGRRIPFNLRRLNARSRVITRNFVRLKVASVESTTRTPEPERDSRGPDTIKESRRSQRSRIFSKREKERERKTRVSRVSKRFLPYSLTSTRNSSRRIARPVLKFAILFRPILHGGWTVCHPAIVNGNQIIGVGVVCRFCKAQNFLSRAYVPQVHI